MCEVDDSEGVLVWLLPTSGVTSPDEAPCCGCILGVDEAELTEPGWNPRLAARKEPLLAPPAAAPEPEPVGLNPSWRVVGAEPRPRPNPAVVAGVVEAEESRAGDTGSAAGEGRLLTLCVLPLLLLLAIAATAANVSAPVNAATVTTSRPLLSRELAMRCTPGRLALRLACAPSMPGAAEAMSTGSRTGAEVKSGHVNRTGSQRMQEAVEDSSRINSDSKSMSSSLLSSSLSLSLSPLSSWLAKRLGSMSGLVSALLAAAEDGEGAMAALAPSLDAADAAAEDEEGFVQHAAHTRALHWRHHTACR